VEKDHNIVELSPQCEEHGCTDGNVEQHTHWVDMAPSRGAQAEGISNKSALHMNLVMKVGDITRASAGMHKQVSQFVCGAFSEAFIYAMAPKKIRVKTNKSKFYTPPILLICDRTIRL
jgi:hypothetical protein